MKKGLIVAGVASGSGKTTFSMGLMETFKRRGIAVSSYKAGPDYIDPMFHRSVLGNLSYNLPMWMVEDDVIKYLFNRRHKEESISIVEGVMGYYDGHGTTSIEGSTAHLAEILNLPVIVIFDASSMALSAAAIVKGLSEFVTPTHIKGVVLNRVKSKSHYEILKSAIEEHTDVKCYGYIEPDPSIAIESRHLGLLQADEIEGLSLKIEKIVNSLEKTVDLDGIFNNFEFSAQIPQNSKKIEDKLTLLKDYIKAIGGFTLGVAMDRAFSFYYQENLDTLRELGIEIVYFSPMNDETIPDYVDAIYLGGGYPEVFGKKLSENKPFRKAILEKLSAGMPCYAECGGLMYLTNEIENLEGDKYPMVGFFDSYSKMTTRLQRFGHIEVRLANDVINESYIEYRAHEFHHSLIEDIGEIEKIITSSRKNTEWKCGYFAKNTLATYAHNHFYSNLDFLEYLIRLWTKNVK